MSPNVHKIATVIGYLELFEKNHSQAWWSNWHDGSRTKTAKELRSPSCGTTMCLAGWTSAIFAPDNAKFNHWDNAFFEVEGEIFRVPDFAQEQLGLTADQKRFCFYEIADELVVPALKYIIRHPYADKYELRYRFNVNR